MLDIRGQDAYLDESVIQNKHDSSEVPGPRLAPEKHLANVTHISDFWVTETKFPDD
jgi:hypothetical protein